MLISLENRTIIFHTPKTGGTSLSAALRPLFDRPERALLILPITRLQRNDRGEIVLQKHQAGQPLGSAEDVSWISPFVLPHPKSPFLKKHSTPQDVVGFFTSEFLESCKYIVPIRDPISRTHSAYRFAIKDALHLQAAGKRNRHYDYLLKGSEPISFSEFISDERTLNLLPSQPQIKWVPTWAAGTENLRLIRTENLAADTAKALLWAGMPDEEVSKVCSVLATTRKNTTARPSDDSEPTAEEADTIRDIYSDDFALYEATRSS
ncbi:sulfotransferase family 2 domain-containing protein [Antarctobacter heliothermus]|uniref:Sulfotransferase family protein n=1 Tax=Antarctobacter heliothermus TaxID=74033 RepID=A0A239JDW8_9RHOB|nr:sulfotransferase family 2 domain-containing protein [Antarctobacter heliothermus]SNT04246.1 Sulfotransferase family protein [Antarctobacter heliothermus]